MEPMKLNIQMFAPDSAYPSDFVFKFVGVENPPSQMDITFYQRYDTSLDPKTITVNFVNGENSGTYDVAFPLRKIVIGDGTLYSATWEECVNAVTTVYIYSNETFTGKILNDNVDNITPNSGYIVNYNPDFSQVATTNEGMFTAEDSDGISTYFRGAVTNNYVKFANFWWRIIRVNGNGSIRLIYDGTTAHANGESSTDRRIGTSAFNTNINDNAYVGYMYGTPGSTTYEATHANINNSEIKTILDNWYESNLSNYSDCIDTEAGFCGDRTPHSGTGIGIDSTYYGAYNRLIDSKAPSFKCTNENSDLFTVSESSKGNKALDHPIGLISADEVAYAGGVYNTSNSSYYLYIHGAYWTMSPFYSSSRARVFIVDSSGGFINYNVNLSYGVRPVINLRGDLSVTGTGTSTDPYEVSLPVVPITNFNGTELTNIYYNGTEISKMYCNGVLVFEKGPTVYKRRIMVGDNLRNKNIYGDFSENFSNELINYYSGSSNGNIFIAPVNSDTTVINKFHDMYGRTPAGDTVRVEFSDEHMFYCLHFDETVEINNIFSMPSDIDYEVGEVSEDSPTYRHLYIEDNKIRPIQEGDVITENTKIYFTWPDNLNPTNGGGQTDAIINFNVVFHIVYKYDGFNNKFNIEAVSWLSSEEKVVLFDQELDINKSYLDLNEFVEGAAISGTISFEGGTLPIEVLNGILVDTTTLG